MTTVHSSFDGGTRIYICTCACVYMYIYIYTRLVSTWTPGFRFDGRGLARNWRVERWIILERSFSFFGEHKSIIESSRRWRIPGFYTRRLRAFDRRQKCSQEIPFSRPPPLVVRNSLHPKLLVSGSLPTRDNPCFLRVPRTEVAVSFLRKRQQRIFNE